MLAVEVLRQVNPKRNDIVYLELLVDTFQIFDRGIKRPYFGSFELELLFEI